MFTAEEVMLDGNGLVKRHKFLSHRADARMTATREVAFRMAFMLDQLQYKE